MKGWEQIRKEIIHKAVDELPLESLTELASFIHYLQYKSKARVSPLREMDDAFAPVREAMDEMGLSEAEIDAIIDETIDEVRRERSSLFESSGTS